MQSPFFFKSWHCILSSFADKSTSKIDLFIQNQCQIQDWIKVISNVERPWNKHLNGSQGVESWDLSSLLFEIHRIKSGYNCLHHCFIKECIFEGHLHSSGPGLCLAFIVHEVWTYWRVKGKGWSLRGRREHICIFWTPILFRHLTNYGIIKETTNDADTCTKKSDVIKWPLKLCMYVWSNLLPDVWLLSSNDAWRANIWMGIVQKCSQL